MGKIWKAIPGFEGYEVARFGKVRSHNSQYGTRKTPRILKPSIDSCGYAHIGLFRNSVRFSRTVHQLVLEVFVGPRPEGYQCCHNDGNPSNNHINNLRWDSAKNNSIDKTKHGTMSNGERQHLSKLKAIDIPEIRRLRIEEHISYRVIGEKFGVTPATIWSVLSGKTWKQI